MLISRFWIWPRDSGEELADGTDVPVVDERMRRLQDVPGLTNELPERRLRGLSVGLGLLPRRL